MKEPMTFEAGVRAARRERKIQQEVEAENNIGTRRELAGC